MPVEQRLTAAASIKPARRGQDGRPFNEHDMREVRISANGLGGIHAHSDHWCRIGWRDVSDIRERCPKEKSGEATPPLPNLPAATNRRLT